MVSWVQAGVGPGCKAGFSGLWALISATSVCSLSCWLLWTRLRKCLQLLCWGQLRCCHRLLCLPSWPLGSTLCPEYVRGLSLGTVGNTPGTPSWHPAEDTVLPTRF